MLRAYEMEVITTGVGVYICSTGGRHLDVRDVLRAYEMEVITTGVGVYICSTGGRHLDVRDVLRAYEMEVITTGVGVYICSTGGRQMQNSSSSLIFHSCQYGAYWLRRTSLVLCMSHQKTSNCSRQ